MPPEMQVSGRDDAGRPILSLLAKRTYAFGQDGECQPGASQALLIGEPRYAADGLVLEEDTDLWPFKPRTDVVVRGHAYNHPQTAQFFAGVSVEGATKTLAVFGDRRCTVARDGRVLFSSPTVPERVALSYALAYGGRDTAAEAVHGNPAALLRPYLPRGTDAAALDAASPFVYPRNPAGRGYLVQLAKGAVEALVLPNLEDPDDLLHPERLAAGVPGRWPLQPLPASLGWLDYGAFPRAAWLGALADHEQGLDPERVAEVRRGHCRPDIFREKNPPDALSLEGANGASLGLRLPHLKGGEWIELRNLSPAREVLRVRLPRQRPKLSVDGREGALVATTPVIHAVVLEPDRSSVAVVWRGSALARRPYTGEELKTMPFAVEW